MSGSNLMFSDLEYENGVSWFESEDNSQLWLAAFDWLTAYEAPEDEVDSPDALNILFFLVIGAIFVIGGMVVFIIAKDPNFELKKELEIKPSTKIDKYAKKSKEETKPSKDAPKTEKIPRKKASSRRK